MPRLPAHFAAVILCFAPLFQQRSWRHAQVLLVGAILAPGQRTVSSILRISGLSRERRFVNYHRILNRVVWSGRAAARVLLGLLLDAFVPLRDPLILYCSSVGSLCHDLLGPSIFFQQHGFHHAVAALAATCFVRSLD
jgi:hypothetical protein